MTQRYCAVTATCTAADIVELVKANCDGHRAARPITAWAPAGPAGELREARVLGWASGSQIHLSRLDEIVALRVADTRARSAARLDVRGLLDMFKRDHLVLAAPWLWYAAACGAVSDLVPVAPSSGWHNPDPPGDDLFALDVSAFRAAFVGIAVQG